MQNSGFNLKSYRDQRDNFEIYGRLHVIFNNMRLSILFKTSTILILVYHRRRRRRQFKIVWYCTSLLIYAGMVSFSSCSHIQYNILSKKLRKNYGVLCYKYLYTTYWSNLKLATVQIGIIWAGREFISYMRY